MNLPFVRLTCGGLACFQNVAAPASSGVAGAVWGWGWGKVRKESRM